MCIYYVHRFTSMKIRFDNSYLRLNLNFVWLNKRHNILHILFFISFHAIFHFSRCHTRKFLRNKEDGRTYWPVYWICQQHQSNKSNQRSAQKSKQIPDLMMIHHYNNTRTAASSEDKRHACDDIMMEGLRFLITDGDGLPILVL